MSIVSPITNTHDNHTKFLSVIFDRFDAIPEALIIKNIKTGDSKRVSIGVCALKREIDTKRKIK